NPPFSNNGAPFTPVPITGSMDGSGAFTQAVPSNSTIKPVGSRWKLTVCPQASSQCFASGNITISGATQDISASVIPPALVINPASIPRVYGTTEATNPQPGSTIFDLSDNALKTWNGSIWVSGGVISSCPSGSDNQIQFAESGSCTGDS